MVSCLVTKGEGSNMSEEEIVAASKGPDISERVSMEMQVLRLTTAQVVLGTEVLFLPNDHPLLHQVQNSVHWGQGVTYPVGTL